MEFSATAARPGLRLGIRQQLILGAGLLSLLFLIVLAVQLLAINSIARSAREAIAEDGELSRLAAEIGVSSTTPLGWSVPFTPSACSPWSARPPLLRPRSR